MRILTFALCFLCFSVSAQNNSINVYPWNPDSDNDNQIGVDDLQSFLTVYGNDFGLPPEPCTYDGTEFEDLMIGVIDGIIILDSIFMEYELMDISSYYEFGCPDPILDTLTFANSAMLYSEGSFPSMPIAFSGDNFSNTSMGFRILFSLSEGLYTIASYDISLGNLGFLTEGFFGGSSQFAGTEYSPLPWPADWYLDEDGIHIESGWSENNWPYYANYMHILPYWHYADE